MKKIFIILFTISILYLFGTVSFAAPNSIDSTYQSNINVIYVTNPEDGITTFKDHSVISLIGQEGVVISIYLFDPDQSHFVLYTESNGESSWKIGSSGLFIKRVPIVTGINYVGVFAELDGNGQFITRRVDREKMSVKEQIKSIFFTSVNDIVKTVDSNNN